MGNGRLRRSGATWTRNIQRERRSLCLRLATPLRGAGRKARCSSATGRLCGAESVAQMKEGRGGVASRFSRRCGMRTNAAPRHANSPPRLRPIVRRLSYELRIASVTLARSLSRRTRHPPPHTQLEKAFHRAGHPQSGCRAAGSEPPAYRFLRATLHALVHSWLAARAHAFHAW